jgi:hypothetical protein
MLPEGHKVIHMTRQYCTHNTEPAPSDQWAIRVEGMGVVTPQRFSGKPTDKLKCMRYVLYIDIKQATLLARPTRLQPLLPGRL